MSKLISSSLSRLGRSRVFWLGNILVTAFCLYGCYMMYVERNRGYQGSLTNIFFNEFMLIGIIMAVVCSLLVGTEYSDGALRNKLIVGHSRINIYFSNFIVCFLAGLTAYLSAMLVYCVGTPLLGGFGGQELLIFRYAVDGVLLCMAYAAVYNMIAMLNANKTYGAVISILTAVIMFVVAYQLYMSLMQPEVTEQMVYSVGEEMHSVTGPNPSYVSGIRRTVYQFLMEIIPTGQGVLLMEFNVRNPYLYGGYSLLLTLCVNAVGFCTFKKKDIK